MRAAVLLAALTLIAPSGLKAQWQIQNAPSTADLRGIDNVGHGIAWASGSNGTILHTEDNGAHWQLCTIPPNADHLDFRGIQAFDADTAIVMSSGKGDLSRLYKTTDGCQTWKLILSNPDKGGFWNAMRFGPAGQDPRQERGLGVLIGDPVDSKFVIYATSDKGGSWHRWGTDRHTRPARARKGESLFAASNSAVVMMSWFQFYFITGGAGGSRIFAMETHDPLDNGPTSKFTIADLLFPSSSTSGAFSVAERLTNPFRTDLMVVGGNYQTPNTPGVSAFLPFRPQGWFDLDLAKQKVISATTPPHGYRSAVAYDAASKTWITVGPNGTDISTDDGHNWRALHPTPGEQPDADQHWNALSLPFVVGPHGRIGILSPSALQSLPSKP